MVTMRGMRAAFLAADGVDVRELKGSWQAVQEAGGEPKLLSTAPGRVRGFRHLEEAETFPVDAVVGEVGVADFDVLVLPGGVANPDLLRMDRAAVALVREFCRAGKPVAAICHAPWLLVEADVVRGREVTSWPSLRTDLVNAGARWVDQPVCVDRDGPNVLVTSRKPADLPEFTEALVSEVAKRARL